MVKSPICSDIVSGSDIGVNIDSFGRHLRAENLSPRTIETYRESARQLSDYLADQGMPLEVANVHREHIEAFLSHLLRNGNRPSLITGSVGFRHSSNGSLTRERSKNLP